MASNPSAAARANSVEEVIARRQRMQENHAWVNDTTNRVEREFKDKKKPLDELREQHRNLLINLQDKDPEEYPNHFKLLKAIEAEQEAIVTFFSGKAQYYEGEFITLILYWVRKEHLWAIGSPVEDKSVQYFEQCCGLMGRMMLLDNMIQERMEFEAGMSG